MWYQWLLQKAWERRNLELGMVVHTCKPSTWRQWEVRIQVILCNLVYMRLCLKPNQNKKQHGFVTQGKVLWLRLAPALHYHMAQHHPEGTQDS